MLSKKQLLLKSIRELQSLNVSDREILLNLKEVGIGRLQAKKLIQEAKLPEGESVQESAADKFIEKFDNKAKVSPKQKAEEIKEEREEATEELATEEISDQVLEENPDEEEEKSALDEIAEEVGQGYSQDDASEEIAKKQEPKKLFEERQQISVPFQEEKPTPLIKTKPLLLNQSRQKESRLVEDVRVSKLWEKGIMGAVSQHLDEMKAIRDDIDRVLDKRIAEASKREMDKINVLFDSQRALMATKVDAEIERKSGEQVSFIESKLREMRGIQEKINQQIDELKKNEQQSGMAKEVLENKLSELDRLREQLVSSLNTELIKSKSQNKQLIEEMNAKLSEMDDRINKTLQLENQIVEGLVKEAEQRVQKMLKDEASELAEINDSKIEELKKIRTDFDDNQKKRLDAFEKEQREKIESMQKKATEDIEGMSSRLKEHMALLGTQLKARLEKLDALEKAVNHEFKPEKFRRQMTELEEFKAQFIDAIQENTQSFNEAMKRLNEQNQQIEKQFMLRAEKIDKKIAELDIFEKNFASEMGLTIEKLTKKPAKK